MLYTIGLAKLSGVQMQPWTEECSLKHDDVLMINESGHRCVWGNMASLNAMKLQTVLPTAKQVEEIERFLEEGGTLFTSIVDPDVIQTVFATREEVDGFECEALYSTVDEGELVKLLIPPYLWIPKAYASIAAQAYNIFQHTISEKEECVQGSFEYVLIKSVSYLKYSIGENGGKIVFSSILANAMKQTDVLNLLRAADHHEQEQVRVECY
ncbi:hypothetical protein [Alicyclobacillus sp. SO9]|uniref:hypothetical protein n=1 Tax=Alicyclobacillus sp. SO9 TaxID=2665646 RepID=UPI0018E72F99|nr:hypothetical protein [Alicyclobacillus sp. SO9]QQE78405.1 hypothetical protein GI364_21425 [Alicyclobacillus sp. SO9]